MQEKKDAARPAFVTRLPGILCGQEGEGERVFCRTSFPKRRLKLK